MNLLPIKGAASLRRRLILSSALLFLSAAAFLLIAPWLSFYIIEFYGAFYALAALRSTKQCGLQQFGFYKKILFLTASQAIYFASFYIYVNKTASIFAMPLSGGVGAILFLLLIRVFFSCSLGAGVLVKIFIVNGMLSMLPSYIMFFCASSEREYLLAGLLSATIWNIAASYIVAGLFSKDGTVRTPG